MDRISLQNVLVVLQERSLRLHSRLLPIYENWQQSCQTPPRDFEADIPKADSWELEALIGTYTVLGESLGELGLSWPNPLPAFLEENVGALEELRRGNLHKAYLESIDALQAAFLAATS